VKKRPRRSNGFEERIYQDHAAQLFLLPAVFPGQALQQPIVLLFSVFDLLHFFGLSGIYYTN
jgi:hypothetical protein